MADKSKFDIGEKVSVLVDKQEYFSKILRIGTEGEIIMYIPSNNGVNLRLVDDKEYILVFYLLLIQY